LENTTAKSVTLHVNQYLLDMIYQLKMTENESQFDCLEFTLLARGQDLNCVTLSVQFDNLMERNAIEAGEADSDFYLPTFRAAPLTLGLLLAEIILERSLSLLLEEEGRKCEKSYRF